MKYNLKTPCNMCPFRTSAPIKLARGRVAGIRESLVEGDGVFPCHKTIDYGAENDEGELDQDYAYGNAQACAGSLILLRKRGQLWESWLNRLATIMGFDPLALDMDAPVFDTWEEMIEKVEE